MDYKSHGKQCSFCPTGATYQDGREATTGPYACGNHAAHLADPKAIDPVSPAMAQQLSEILADEGDLEVEE